MNTRPKIDSDEFRDELARIIIQKFDFNCVQECISDATGCGCAQDAAEAVASYLISNAEGAS